MTDNNLNRSIEKVLAVVGLISIIIISLYLIFRLVGIIYNIPGYSFDPFNFTALVVLIKLISDLHKKQKLTLDIQSHLLNTMINNSQAPANPPSKSKKSSSLRYSKDSKQITVYKPKRGRPKKHK
ncbi:MAG: hypothetical protein AAGF07_00535 [Patescibacteria group bacterium]